MYARVLCRALVSLACCLLVLHTASCDFVFGDDTIDGTWKGTMPIGENMLLVELEMTQSLLYRWLYQVTGTGRYTYVEAGLSVSCTIKGKYILSLITVDLEANGFAPVTIQGEVSEGHSVIKGKYIVRGHEFSITLYRE